MFLHASADACATFHTRPIWPARWPLGAAPWLARTMAAAERLFLVSFFGPSHKPTPIISSSAAATAGPAKLGPPITVRTTVGSGSSAPLSQLESGCCEHWHGTRESAKGFPIEVKEWVRGSRASLKKDENGVGSAGETSSPRTLSPSAACPVLD